jgi:hypothetical protein
MKVFQVVSLIIVFSLLKINYGFSQSSLDDIDVIFKHDFNQNTLGYYTYSEWASDWLNPEWCNRQSSLQIAQDAGDAVNATKSLLITYPYNSLGPSEGGTNWNTMLGGKYSEIYVSYDFMLMPGFQFQKGGKFPSVKSGSVEVQGDFIRPDGYDGFAGGLMFNSDGNITSYIYYPDSKVAEYGETFAWGVSNCPADYFLPSVVEYTYGKEGGAVISRGVWHNLTYRLVANSVPSEGNPNYDGLIEGYLDGELLMQLSHILWRRTNNLGIDCFRMCTFFGGNADSWRNPIEEWMKVDNVLLYTFKSDTTVPRGNTLSPTTRRINYWRNFGLATPEPEPEPPVDTTLSADIVKVNFVKDETILASSDWNNMISAVPGVTHHLKNEQGQASNLDLYVSSSQIYNSAGGSFPGVYPDEVLKTSWRADNHTTKTIQLKNLDTSKKYKFQIFGSNQYEIVGNDPVGTYLNQYTVANITKSMCVYQNTNNLVSWVILPESSTIDISWTGGTGHYGFLNSLVISLADEDEPVDTVVVVQENSQPQIQAQTINLEEINYNDPLIGTVTASDPDEGQTLTYSIVSGNNDNLFTIDQQTGAITTTSDDIFRYSTLEYELVVKVEDDAETKKSNQATITIQLVPDTKVVYIDPTNIDDPLEDGTIQHPFNSWQDVTWKTDFKYLQKRGTSISEEKIGVYSSGATIGAYGEGDYPVILSTAKDYAIQALDKESLAVTNIHIIADDAISAIYVLGNVNGNYNIQNCIIENSDYGVRIVEGKQITLKYNTFKNCIRGVYSFAAENNIYYNIFKGNNNALEIASLISTTNVFNNVFYENGSGVSSSHGDLTLYNNIFYLTNDGDVALNLNLDKFLSDNNIFYPERDGFLVIADKSYNKLYDFTADYNLDLNSLCKDPMFVDVYNDNFSLSQNSPAINTGKVLSLDKDFYGISVPYSGFPDIGIAEATFSNLTTAIDEESDEGNKLSIYPNPSRGVVNIEISDITESNIQPSILKVIDQTGKTVYSKEINTDQSDLSESIDLSDKNNGIYFFMFQTVDKTITEKLLLMH